MCACNGAVIRIEIERQLVNRAARERVVQGRAGQDKGRATLGKGNTEQGGAAQGEGKAMLGKGKAEQGQGQGTGRAERQGSSGQG